MKILLVMDSGIKVPPDGYGGHERLVYLMAKEYRAMGHEVHLLVTKGSQVPGCTVHGFGKEEFPQGFFHRMWGLLFVWRFLLRKGRDFDLIHNFGRLAFLFPVLNSPVKKIMTYGREITSRNILYISKLPQRNLIFTGASMNLINRVRQKGLWRAVYNTIDFSIYDAVSRVPGEAPFIFLGRIERIKGCHLAIKVAKTLGRKLIIAGNISPLPDERKYFEKEIKPWIDGEQIQYVGALDDSQKNYWLGKSAALLFPIEWEEPFGIVMIEAMACGTPVIALRRGSVEEVVEEGVTGFKVDNLAEMISAAARIAEIDRAGCRLRSESRFNLPGIARQYLDLFSGSASRILIISTGQPSGNPRVMKEYRALKAAGHYVKVLYPYSAEWSHKIDEFRFRSGKLDRNDFVMAGGSPSSGWVRFILSRFIFKFIKICSRKFRIKFFMEMSISPHALNLYLRAGRMKADLVIAHYLGSLPAARRVARRQRARLIFDAEDFHRGEEPYYKGQTQKSIEVEHIFFPLCDHITAASDMIAAAYRELFPEISITTIENVFSVANLQPVADNGRSGISLFWFSQFIGPKRGLEVVFEAINLINDPRVTIHILGNLKYEKFIQDIYEQSNHPENIHLINTVEEDELFRIASGFDVGLAAEVPYCLNRDICLTNKIFTYLLSGNCILASNTRAQEAFIREHPGLGFCYDWRNPADLAQKIKMLLENREMLLDCRRKAAALAKSELNWEKESVVFLGVVRSVLENARGKN